MGVPRIIRLCNIIDKIYKIWHGSLQRADFRWWGQGWEMFPESQLSLQTQIAGWSKDLSENTG